MTGLLITLLALHAALSAAGFYWLWRQNERRRAEIARLNELLAARAAAPARAVRTAEGGVVSISDLTAQRPRPRPKTAYTYSGRRRRRSAQTLSAETLRTLVLCLLAVAPALGLFFTGAEAAVVASGLAISAAMMVVALRPIWSAAAWASVITASAWAAVGIALGTAAAEPLSYALGLALAGVCGLINAHLRRAAPGATLALLMAGVALALASQAGLFSAPGAAYALIVATAAIVGALSLRLEALHLVAFGAAVLGLFVLSGQDSAAIWFTPATAWSGALFLAIAAVRVPQLGARGVALAGAGAFAPLGAISALHDAQHGLADPVAAALAFLALAVSLAGVLTLAALRRPGGLAGLRYVRWVLSLGAFIAIAAAITLTLPPQLAAAAFGAVALGLAGLNARISDLVWRVFAVIAALLATGFAFATTQALLAEASGWPPALAAIAGLAVPALTAGGAAFLFERYGAPRVAAFFEAAALIFALAAAHMLTRIGFADGATLLRPVSFVEAAGHCSLWLAASLAIAARDSYGAADLRDGAALGLAAVGLAGLIVCGVLWLVSAWPSAPEGAWYARASLAFLIPSALLWAHWWFWRQRKTAKRARVAFAAAGAALAAFLLLELVGLPLPLWAKIGGGLLLGVLAIGANFAPGLTANGDRLRLRERSPSQSATQAAR